MAELARDHAVSAVTVHRDLEELARDGLVERVHGGARSLPGGPGAAVIPTAWTQRELQAGMAKDAIAQHALRFIDPGATIFLDASSSALALARRLMDEPPNEITLVTNSPAIAYEIQADTMHVVVCPGELDQHMRMLAGRWTVEFLAELNFAVAFLSAAGVTLDQGLTTARRPLADVVQVAMASAERSVGLIDSSKFGRSALMSIARADALDAIVTDAGLPPDVADDYRAANVRLEIAQPEESP